MVHTATVYWTGFLREHFFTTSGRHLHTKLSNKSVQFIHKNTLLTLSQQDKCQTLFANIESPIWDFPDGVVLLNNDNVDVNVAHKQRLAVSTMYEYLYLYSVQHPVVVTPTAISFVEFCCSLQKLTTICVDGTPTARRRLKSPQSLSGISAHTTMVTLVYIMVMNGWLTSFSFHVNRPSHSWDKAISDSDLEISTPGSRSWVWSKCKVIQSAQYHINSLCFHFRPTIPEIELFRNLTLKHPRSRSWVRSKFKVTYCTQYPTDTLPFRFTSIGPTIPEIWPK